MLSANTKSFGEYDDDDDDVEDEDGVSHKNDHFITDVNFI